MAMPQAFGFLPMEDALSMNWQQSLRPPSSYDVMSTLLDAQRQAGRDSYAAQPMASSFLDRFGGPMLGQSQPQQAAQQQLDPEMLSMLLGGLRSAVAGSNKTKPGNNSAMMNPDTPQETILQGTGRLQDQPWYDEYLLASQQGADVPMVKGNAPAMSDAARSGIQERRQERLSGTLPMAERRANVRNDAIAKGEQRAARMGDLSPNQQFFNEAGRFQENMGGEGGDFLNGIMFGGPVMADMHKSRLVAEQSQAQRDWAESPGGMAAAAAANGNRPPLPADPGADLVARAGGDWDRFKVIANASGMTAQETLDTWRRVTGQDRGGPTKPGFFDILGSLFQNAPAYQHQNSQPYPIPYG